MTETPAPDPRLETALDSVRTYTAELRATIVSLDASYTGATQALLRVQASLAKAEAEIARLEALRPARILVGGATGSNADPSAIETKAGATFGCRRTYWDNLKTTALLTTAAADLAKGRVPLLSAKIKDATGAIDWAGDAAGKYDAWARDTASKLAAIKSPLPRRIVIAHEPEGDGDLKAWTAMQLRLAPLFDLPGIDFGVCTTGYHQIPGTTQAATYGWDKLLPASTPGIKFLAIDPYQKSFTSDQDKFYYAPTQAEATKRGMFWSVWETGADVAYTPGWIAAKVAQAKARGCADWAYFNSNLNSSQKWAIVADTAKETDFLQTLKATA